MGIRRQIKGIIEAIKRPKLVPVYYKIDNEQLKGKVALITGGTGGIGKAIAKQLIEDGATVIITGTNEKKLKEIGSELKCFTSVLDYSNPSNINKDIEEIIKKYKRIDIFISSAGVHTENVNFWSMNPEEFERVMKVNLEGTFFASQAVGKYMIDNKIKGKILLVSSSRGSEPAWSPYGISKWGLRGLTEGLAKMFLPYGIVVNSIAPGSTATKLIGYSDGNSIYSTENMANRLIVPEEVASLAKYLVSDECQMVAGETIHISAGRGVFEIR